MNGEENPFSPNAGDGSSGLSDLGSGFLSKVDPADRPVVERYVKDWDRGVNERFQSLHNEYKPYKDLGVPYDDIVSGLHFKTWIDNDPQGFLTTLAENLAKQNIDIADLLGIGVQQQPPSGSQVPEGWENLPEDFRNRFSQMEQMLQLVGETQIQTNQRSLEKQEDAEFDDYLQELRQVHGDYDEQFVTAMIAAGYDGPEAVAMYQERYGNSQQPSPRPQLTPLNGSGSVGHNGFDPTKATSKDVRSLVGQLLANAKGES